MKFQEQLTKLGLTIDQAKIYEVLLGTPLLPARIIAKNAGVGRELTYGLLKKLEEINLVERLSDKKIILFRVKHPRQIKNLLLKKEEEFLNAQKSYHDTMGQILAEYNIAHNKPFIKFYEGKDGLKKVYEHINKYAKEVRVIRSLYDYENSEIRAMITDQLQKQAEKNILSYVLSPALPHMKEEKLLFDPKRNIVRKIVDKKNFSLPAQVIIYNNTVSITTMKDDIITTIIENKDIADTFKKVFEYAWNREN